MEETIEVSDALLFLLLALSSLVVLEPVEDVLTLDMSVRTEPTGDLLYLIGARGSYALLVKILKQRYLILRWVPPGTASRSCAPFVFHLSVAKGLWRICRVYKGDFACEFLGFD